MFFVAWVVFFVAVMFVAYLIFFRYKKNKKPPRNNP